MQWLCSVLLDSRRPPRRGSLVVVVAFHANMAAELHKTTSGRPAQESGELCSPRLVSSISIFNVVVAAVVGGSAGKTNAHVAVVCCLGPQTAAVGAHGEAALSSPRMNQTK